MQLYVKKTFDRKFSQHPRRKYKMIRSKTNHTLVYSAQHSNRVVIYVLSTLNCILLTPI